jgi:ABC-type Fe3+-hydroxamate transport system substrate-binding protein
MQTARGGWRRWMGLALAVCAGANSTNAQPPRRIVSLNLCTDQLLGALVPHDRIAAISFLGADRTLSASARELSDLKAIRGSAEEVLALEPDLVIAGEYTTGATVELLRRLGQHVFVVPLVADFDGMRKTIRMIGAEVEEPAKAEEMIADFDERLRAARSVVTSKPQAIAIWRAIWNLGRPGACRSKILLPRRRISSCSPTDRMTFKPCLAIICAIRH